MAAKPNQLTISATSPAAKAKPDFTESNPDFTESNPAHPGCTALLSRRMPR
jgi:hypothetical protein